MKLLLVLAAFSAQLAGASILEDTLTDDVNKSSTHIDCSLVEPDSAEFSSYSRVVIGTEFGDDAPRVTANDSHGKADSNAYLSNFSDHDALNMRIFEIEDLETGKLVNLIVVYTKKAGKIEAQGVLTSNGQENPVVNAADMKCKYVGPMAINR